MPSTRRSLRSTALAVAAGALVALTGAPAAQAAAPLEIDMATSSEVQDFYGCDAKVGDTYSMGCFNDNGDVFYTADWERDSMRAAVHWRLSDGSRRGLCITTKGPAWVPTVGWVGTRLACDKDLPEGKRVEIRSGRCDGTIHSCKKLSHYQDWTAWDAATV
ncbi:hypothetical protein [Paraconexibacter algicola]|uniref:Secreted protein n=1 Tax=Paraconexibacter algicola TaxID=2133960 RepID=A0A2T4UCA7_9ACTN|nr:hypothetical protein [Paraconexibacter algicola]PTL54865.1 hypothetical protein C7Y72_19990 [Paraconexibacter algicola]